jgi:FixJ family two-component response regulator
MDDAQSLVVVVDDDESVRRALRWLLMTAGYSVATFSSGAEMLEHRPDQPACLLVDIRMPDMTGLEVKEAREDGAGHGDHSSRGTTTSQSASRR